MCAVCQINEDEEEGDVLVFLTGQEEIESLGRLLRARSKLANAASGVRRLHVVLLFAALPPEEQMRVFEPTPPGSRKIVLATNIAETSLTINGIKYVVDCGLTKQRIYHPRSGVDELVVSPVAVSQAMQRAGRAGREGPGKCFRLYCESVLNSLEPHVKPELLRTNLGGVVLQLKAMGVDDVLSFPFIDAPPKEALVRSLELLFALGALGKDGKLTSVGKKMSRFPLEPMAAKAIIAAANEGCGEDTVAVLSMLTTDSVFKQHERGAGGVREKNTAREEGRRPRHVLGGVSSVSRVLAEAKEGVGVVQRRAPPVDAQGARHLQATVARGGGGGRGDEVGRVRDRAAAAIARVRLLPEHGEETGGRKLQDDVHGAAARDSPVVDFVSLRAGDDPVQRARENESAVRAGRVVDTAGVARGALAERVFD
jgi:HrpA-like RNA helicase